jgi:hypothetical protein
MMKIAKQVVMRIWPILVGMIAFMVMQLMQSDSLAIVPFYALGPFLGIMQQLPLLQWIPMLVIGILLMATHIAWPKWYTAIVSMGAAYLWCYMGMGAAGASC